MAVATILKDENVKLLEVDGLIWRQTEDPDNAGTVDAVITSSRSAGRNLVDLSGHSYLSLTLLLRVALLRTIHPLSSLFLYLP